MNQNSFLFHVTWGNLHLVYTLYTPCIYLVYTLYAFGPNIMDIPHIVDIPHIMDILHMCPRTPKIGTSACIAEGFDGGIYTLYIPCIYLPPYPIYPIYLEYTLYVPCIYLVYTLHIPCTYLVYTLYIPCILLVY